MLAIGEGERKENKTSNLTNDDIPKTMKDRSVSDRSVTTTTTAQLAHRQRGQVSSLSCQERVALLRAPVPTNQNGTENQFTSTQNKSTNI